MQRNVTVYPEQGPRYRPAAWGRLDDEHARASYGLPVLIIDRSAEPEWGYSISLGVYGPGDLRVEITLDDVPQTDGSADPPFDFLATELSPSTIEYYRLREEGEQWARGAGWAIR